MKKVSKLLALFLAVIVMMSSFSIMPSAISSSSSKEEILAYYEKCLRKISEKEDFVKAEYTHKETSVLYSEGLSEKEQKELSDLYNYERKTERNRYFHGDAYEEYFVNGRSEFTNYFSINRSIQNGSLIFKKATYKSASNGEATVTLVCEKSDYIPPQYTYTVKIDKNGYIKSLTLKVDAALEFESVPPTIEGFLVKQTVVDTYKFVYRKVAVTGIGLPKTHIRLAKDKEYALEPIIYPLTATYQDFYVEVIDTDIVNSDYDENGNPYIYGVGLGTTTVKLYTYDGEYMAELEVTVTDGSFFDAIIDFFRSIFEFFRGFLML